MTETLLQPSTTSVPDNLFADGFESGNLSGWTSNANGSGRLSAATAAALAGAYGMQADFNGTTTAIHVTDDQPNAEPRYRARFYFDPNSAVMANNTAHYIFYGYTGASTVVLRLELGYTTANGYRLRLSARDNASAWTTGSWVNIADAPHVIELDWQSSTNGSLNWWIDEAPQTALTNVDNSARRIDRVRLGAVAGVDATTNGTLYFDAFESRRSTYIGPMASPVTTTTIDYMYDSLYRLTEASYSDGRYFRYTYDAAGNRLTETRCALLPCGAPVTNTYVYDIANRLTSVNGQAYTWDDNGNLLNDGASTYTYDTANRLTSVIGGGNTSTYTYNGLGDRLSQTVNGVTTNYTLDLNANLTLVLADGTNTYLYGIQQIGELQPGGFAYHLGDALGSVRQLADGTAAAIRAQSYQPFGSELNTSGTATSIFGFASEQIDVTGLSYNRARYYSSGSGRFLSLDAWPGDPNSPMTQHGYLYAYANPILFTDPSGRDPWWCEGRADEQGCIESYTPAQASPWSALTPQQQRLAQMGFSLLGQYAQSRQQAQQTQSILAKFGYGVVFQFLDDESFGFTSLMDPAMAQNTDPWFVTGRHFGRGFSTAFSAAEIAIGIGGCGGGAAGALPTGGATTIVIAGGVVIIVHGGAVIVRNIATAGSIPLPNFSMMSTDDSDTIIPEEITPADIVGKNPTLGGLPVRAGQQSVDKRIVEDYIRKMLRGDFSWIQLDKIHVIRDAKGYLLTDGHHKFIAARWLDKEIPSYAFEVTRDVRPDTYISVPWEEVVWEIFRNWDP